MKIRTALFLLFSSLTAVVSAQPALAWAQSYNGPPDYGDEAHDIVVDNAGNAYVTGSAFAANGTLDMVTIKYSPSGQQLWLQSYNGTGNDNDEAFQIVMSDSGFVYVVGYSKGTSSMQDITTIKYSAAGVQMWAVTYNGGFNNYDAGNALTVDASGNVYVTGVETTANYTYDIVTLKYSAGGSQLWVQTYDGPGNFNDESKDIGLDASNNVYVVGTQDTFYNSQPNEDMILMKYNNSGSLQWKRIYDGPGHGYEYARKLGIDGNNNITITGYAFVTGNGMDVFTLQFTAAGAFNWLQEYNSAPTKFDQPYDMAIDAQGNIFITGQSIQANNNNYNDYLTLKYNSAGTFQWAERYDGPAGDDDRAYGICVDDSSDIVVTGYSKSSTSGLDIATVKYDQAGNQKWVVRFNNAASHDDVGNAVTTAPNGDVYLCGRSANLSNDDYITLRYSYSAVGIAEQQDATALSIFPNPSNGDVRILVPVAGNPASSYTIAVTNSLGQRIETSKPVTGESNGAEDVLLIGTTGWAPGVYLIQVSLDSKPIGNARVIIR